jgi:hypothetical protein
MFKTPVIHEGRASRPSPSVRTRISGSKRTRAIRRRLREASALLVALALSPPAWLYAAPAPAPGGAVRASEVGAAGATLTFTLDSYRRDPVEGTPYTILTATGLTLRGSPGAPALPVKSVPLIAPRGARIEVRVVSEDVEWLADVRPAPWPSEVIQDDGVLPHSVAELKPDDRYYARGATYPASVVGVEEAGTLRGRRIVSVVFWPFRYDAAGGGLEVRRAIVVRVDFVGGERGIPSPETSGDVKWEPLLRGLFPNYEQAKGWRHVQPRIGAIQRMRSAVGPDFKIRIARSSLYRVYYDDLATLGLTQDVPAGELRLYDKYYSPSTHETVETEVPIVVNDSDSDGIFGPGESFVFYGLSYWDRFPEKYGTGASVRPHVYWLSLRESGGARMTPAEAWGDFAETVTPTSFPESMRLHEDHALNRAPYKPDVYLFWSQSGLADEVFHFEVPSPDPGSSYGVRMRFQPSERADHAFSLYPQNKFGGIDTLIVRGIFSSVGLLPSGKPPYTYYSGRTGKPGFLSNGENSLRVIGEELNRGSYLPGLGAYIDWFEIDYDRLYAAWNDSLTCTADTLETPQQIEVEGFTSPEILAFDVTDPLSPRVFDLDERNVVDAGGSYTLVIRGLFADRSRIAAATAGAVVEVGPADMELDHPSDLRAEGAGSDYLIVVYDGFASEIEPLAALRESQGFKVAVARASDVYDEFGDGYKSPEAIKSYFNYAYNNWGAAYGLLVGDANEDREGVLVSPQGNPSPPDFLPSYLILHTEVSSAPLGPEIVNSDPWYGAQLDGDTGDWIPDMFMGRISSGSAQETHDVVDKIVRYESYGAADVWRSRGLFVADDDYSTSIFANGVYCRQTIESAYFEPVSDRLSSMLTDSATGVPGFAAPVFKLRSYVGKFPTDPKPRCLPGLDLFDVQDYTREHATPALVDTMSLGWLFVNYQGHGNEDVWTHETMFASFTGLSPMDDVTSLGNTSRPFALFAYSCHVSDFDDRREADSGDCISERMVLLPEAGAIAAFASAGYEYLTTAPFNEPVMEAMLIDPPVDEDTDEAYIRLGPALAKGEISYYLTSPGSNQGPLRSFCTLGDPGLTIDAAPPRIYATLGDSLLADGDKLEESTGADTLALRFEIRDEVAVDSASVSVKEIWHRTEGQDSTYVVPASEHPLTLERQGRTCKLGYTVSLLPASMDLVVAAVDRNGRKSSITLRAVLSALWKADGKTLSQDDLVAAMADFSVTVSGPVPMDGSLLSVSVDGTRVSAFEKRQIDAEGREWELAARAFHLADGSHTLSLLVDGRPVKTARVRVETGFRFASFIPYPSPCDEKGTTFFYELTTTGNVEIADLVLKIYSVSGRLVAELKDPAPAIGRGSIYWAAVDDHGDRVGNGVYICRAVAIAEGGRKATVLGKVAVAR